MTRSPRTELVELSLEDGLCCPACREGLGSGEALLACPACGAVAHRACLSKFGACVTFGCPNGPSVPRLPRAKRSRTLALAVAGLLAAGGLAAYAATDQARPPRPVPPRVRYLPLPCTLPHNPHEEAPAPRPAPARSAPVPREVPDVRLSVPTTTRSDEVLIRGKITGQGPLRVEVHAPTGDVAWDAFEPGPFVTAVTLGGPGRHEVRVVVVDADGRRAVTTYTVERRP